MTLFAGIGYALLSLGPALSLFLTVIVFKPFLVLTVLSSALVWLISLILIATVWRAFLPIGFSPWLFALLLLTCVSFQEAIRPVFWKMFKRVESFLNSLAERISKPRLSIIDKLQISLAAGLGHGVAHAVFFSISLLTPAFGQATFYVESCTSMPFFLVTALSSLGFVLIHTFSMVIAFDGYAEGKRMHQVFAPAMHISASFLTLVNLMPQGCLAGVPLVLGCALVTMLYCAKIFWDKTGQPLSDPRRR